jgi:c-di-AMP phosphodiesterase-like protein
MPFNVRTPLIHGFTIDLFDVGVLISGFILTFSLGKHNGNVYTYYGELLLPFLLYSIIPKIDDIFKIKQYKALVQLLILVLCIFSFRVKYTTNFKSNQEAFTSLYQYADSCPTIYDETPLIAMYKIDQKMYPLYNNGHVEYAWTIDPARTIFGILSAHPTNFFNQSQAKWNDNITSKIKNQEFACIFTDKTQEIDNYQQVGKIDNVLGQTINVWVPREP